MATKVKVSHKELKGPDKFARFIDKSATYVSDNYKNFLYFISAFIAIIILLFLFFNYKNKKIAEANSVYNEAISYIENQDHDKAIEKFTILQKNYSRQKISKLSNYYLASVYYEKGSFDKSIEYAENYLKEDINEPNLIDATYMLLTVNYFNKKEWNKSIDHASRIQNNESPYYNDANFIKGLSLEKLGKNNEASAIYNEILTEAYPNQFSNSVN